jgi:hypothetical protein
VYICRQVRRRLLTPFFRFVFFLSSTAPIFALLWLGRAPNNNVVIIPNNPPQARFDLCNLAAADPSGLEIMPYLAEEY